MLACAAAACASAAGVREPGEGGSDRSGGAAARVVAAVMKGIEGKGMVLMEDVELVCAYRRKQLIAELGASETAQEREAAVRSYVADLAAFQKAVEGRREVAGTETLELVRAEAAEARVEELRVQAGLAVEQNVMEEALAEGGALAAAGPAVRAWRAAAETSLAAIRRKELIVALTPAYFEAKWRATEQVAAAQMMEAGTQEGKAAGIEVCAAALAQARERIAGRMGDVGTKIWDSLRAAEEEVSYAEARVSGERQDVAERGEALLVARMRVVDGLARNVAAGADLYAVGDLLRAMERAERLEEKLAANGGELERVREGWREQVRWVARRAEGAEDRRGAVRWMVREALGR